MVHRDQSFEDDRPICVLRSIVLSGGLQAAVLTRWVRSCNGLNLKQTEMFSINYHRI